MAVARSISSTVICSYGSSQIWLPPMEEAWEEVVTLSSSEREPFSRSSMTSSMVMILVMEAGAWRSSALYSNSTMPLSASMRMAELQSSAEAVSAHAVTGERAAMPAASRPASIGRSVLTKNRFIFGTPFDTGIFERFFR